MTGDRHASFSRTLAAMQGHQQGHHGWNAFHRALLDLTASSDPALDRILAAVRHKRPSMSDSHLITLLGIAVRQLASTHPDVASVFEPGALPAERSRSLGAALDRHETEAVDLLTSHSNSFTGARRFLVPQLLIGGFARHFGVDEVRLLDVGTGLGALPRQLNNREVFDRFAADLTWLPERPPYLDIPLAVRHGIDAAPLPTTDWVGSCHGPSAYYEDRWSELVWSLERAAATAGQVRLSALDVLDRAQLAGFLRTHRFNVITCNFVLYQYEREVRERLIAELVGQLAAPGLFLSMEPSHDLVRQGSRVTGYLAGDPRPLHLADAEDAHFIGRVTAGADLAAIIGPGTGGGS
ncbi:hypothetical protein [Kitasatospora sp. CB02891]|uniref:hypothetical protein n=1 Tax=Kitasatospora sp. CB02891 TaxID=2020329 RepID=UPI000C27F963|nr:hypothetical protein [Kitasatospora sp. CB02891]PJN22572.1 hypothetical protein CG736_26925 [Kitasatospora sp. CB02891]